MAQEVIDLTEGVGEATGERRQALPDIDEDFLGNLIDFWNLGNANQRLFNERVDLTAARSYIDGLKSLKSLQLDSDTLARLDEELQARQGEHDKFWEGQLEAINKLLANKLGTISLRVNGERYPVQRVVELDGQPHPVILDNAVVDFADIEKVSIYG